MVCGLAAGSAMAVHAQNGLPLKADIPFGFSVGDTLLPPGEYDVRKIDQTDFLFIRQADGQHPVLRLVLPAGGGERAARNELVFRRYGDNRYFLGEVRQAGQLRTAWLPKSKTEKEAVTSTLVTSVKPAEVVILARTR